MTRRTVPKELHWKRIQEQTSREDDLNRYNQGLIDGTRRVSWALSGEKPVHNTIVKLNEELRINLYNRGIATVHAALDMAQEQGVDLDPSLVEIGYRTCAVAQMLVIRKKIHRS